MRFATDATLGKLGRHLRAAGFDVVCRHESRAPDFFDTLESDRILLTRTSTLMARHRRGVILFIRYDDPWLQMIQVVQELNIEPGDIAPFSRCLSCNLEIKPVDKQSLKGRIPAYIWQHHQAFRICSGCDRVYWAGSHHQRLTKRLGTLFKDKGSSSHEQKTA